jgi:hypothetical protein
MANKQTQPDLGDNLTATGQLLDSDDDDMDVVLSAAPPAAKKPRATREPIVKQRVRIMLEDNDAIPPGGQFIQVNGKSFLILAGHEVEVPPEVVDVLDHAVMSVPIVDEMQSVIGYRDRLRFPYRVITKSRGV